jgi:hypothetical protein
MNAAEKAMLLSRVSVMTNRVSRRNQLMQTAMKEQDEELRRIQIALKELRDA